MPSQQIQGSIPLQCQTNIKGRQKCAPFRNVIVGILILFLDLNRPRNTKSKRSLCKQSVTKDLMAKEELETLCGSISTQAAEMMTSILVQDERAEGR